MGFCKNPSPRAPPAPTGSCRFAVFAQHYFFRLAVGGRQSKWEVKALCSFFAGVTAARALERRHSHEPDVVTVELVFLRGSPRPTISHMKGASTSSQERLRRPELRLHRQQERRRQRLGCDCDFSGFFFFRKSHCRDRSSPAVTARTPLAFQSDTCKESLREGRSRRL